MFGWTTTADPAPAEDGNQVNENQGLNHRNTRRERELLRDIQNMSNKCVELTIDLHNKKTLMESFTGKTNSIKMKSLAKESTILAKERDRMMHNAKAATWKLQEVRSANVIFFKFDGGTL